MSQALPLVTLEAIAARANEAHRQVNQASSTTLSLAKHAGEILSEAKGQIPHGAWIPWLEAHFEGSVRTAQLYIQVFENWAQLEANTQHVSHLSLRGALAKLSDKEPTDDMRELHDAVQTVTKEVLKKLSTSGQSLKTTKHKAEAIAETILTGAVMTPNGQQIPATDYIAPNIRLREQEALGRQQHHVDEKLGFERLPKEQTADMREGMRYAPLDFQERYSKRWNDPL